MVYRETATRGLTTEAGNASPVTVSKVGVTVC